MNSTSASYRPDIDGLRAIAILAVLIFHAFPELLPGEFVGVDVFFVISGFLITRIIFAWRKDAKFSFARFYARRISRLFPALVVVLAFCLIYGWFVLLPDEYQLLGRHVRGGALYISNYLLNDEAGYFDVEANLKPLLHLWSLAIEEQFYIAWPIFAVILYRRPIDLFAFITLLLVGSFVANIVWIGFNPVETYFLPYTRAWELLVGVLMAHVGHFGWIGRGFRLLVWHRAWWADLAAVAGIGAIVASAFALNASEAFPGWWGVVPVLGTALVIAAGPSAWVSRTLLAHPVAVFLGLISYPLYLWHWPLLSLARIIEGETLPISHRVAIVGISLVLAVLTYLLVERPIRLRTGSRLSVASVLLVLLLGLGAAGHAIAKGEIPPYADRMGVDHIMAAAQDWAYPTKDMESLVFQGRNVLIKKGASELGPVSWRQQRRTILAADAIIAERGASIVQNGHVPYRWGMSTYPRRHRGNSSQMQRLRRYRPRTRRAAGHWYGGDGGSMVELFRNANLPDRRHGPIVASRDATRPRDFLGDVIAQWVAAGRHIYLVLDTPMGPKVDPKSMVERTFLAFKIVPSSGIARSELDDRYGAISRGLRDVASRAGAIVIDPLDSLCAPQGICPATTPDGEPIYKDAAHLRPGYVRQHVQFLDMALRN